MGTPTRREVDAMGSVPPHHSLLEQLVRKTRRIPAHVGQAPANLGRVVRALATDPGETLRYLPETVSHHLFDAQVAYEVEGDVGPTIHKMLDLAWPCEEQDHFETLWERIGSDLAAQGLPFGRWTYGEYSDADPALGAVTWCAVRHLRPATVIETGVARGVTSRVILEAMRANGAGHLWSVDLPHPFRPELHRETAAAVPASCRDRWSYVRGSSRRRLPSLVSRLGEVDLFVHDSLHTGRNMRFELRTVWPAMPRGALALVDDVDNQSFRDFVREVHGPASRVLRSSDGPWMFGVIRKDGAAAKT
jgi:hypothetical protein